MSFPSRPVRPPEGARLRPDVPAGWLGEDSAPSPQPPARLSGCRLRPGPACALGLAPGSAGLRLGRNRIWEKVLIRRPATSVWLHGRPSTEEGGARGARREALCSAAPLSRHSASVCSGTSRRVNATRAFTGDGHSVSPEKSVSFSFNQQTGPSPSVGGFSECF